MTSGDFDPHWPRGADYRARYRQQTGGGEFHALLAEEKSDEIAGIYSDDDPLAEGFNETATYDYTDPQGSLLYQVVRYEHSKVRGAKQFRQRRRGQTSSNWIAKAGPLKVPYNWPDLITRASEPVYYVEGEKDADRLMSLGLLATTLAGQNWSNEAVRAFEGRDIIILGQRRKGPRECR